MHQTSRKSVLRKCSLPLWRWAHELCHACLGHCFLMALIGLCQVSVSWQEQMGTGLHSLLCGLEGCADYTVLERRGVEGVAGGTHVAPQSRQCWWRPVLPWAASWGWELFVLLLQCRFVDGMWKEQILRKRRKRRKGWSKWIVKKEGEREVKEWRKAKWEERWRKWGDGQVHMKETGNIGSPA